MPTPPRGRLPTAQGPPLPGRHRALGDAGTRGRAKSRAGPCPGSVRAGSAGSSAEASGVPESQCQPPAAGVSESQAPRTCEGKGTAPGSRHTQAQCLPDTPGPSVPASGSRGLGDCPCLGGWWGLKGHSEPAGPGGRPNPDSPTAGPRAAGPGHPHGAPPRPRPTESRREGEAEPRHTERSLARAVSPPFPNAARPRQPGRTDPVRAGARSFWTAAPPPPPGAGGCQAPEPAQSPGGEAHANIRPSSLTARRRKRRTQKAPVTATVSEPGKGSGQGGGCPGP